MYLDIALLTKMIIALRELYTDQLRKTFDAQVCSLLLSVDTRRIASNVVTQ